MKPIRNAVDLAEARSQPRAFIFLWVNWAIQARQSQKTVERLVVSWKAACPEVLIPAYIVDLSDGSGELWEAVRDWLRDEHQPVDSLTYGGGGALLWVMAGSVIAHCPFTAQIDNAKLLATTRERLLLNET